MNLNKLFYDWSNEVYVDRNNLVFEGKNQAYGAYQIRQEYNKVVVISMLAAFLGIGLLVSIPSIIQYFRDVPMVERVLPHDDGPIPLDPEQFVEKPIVPPQETHLSVPKPDVSTIANIVPEVVNKPITIDDKLAVNDILLDNITGTETKVGKGSDIVLDEKPIIEEEKNDKPVVFAQKMPSFVGGDDALLNYMRNHVHYPELEKEMGISGTVYVSFIIDKLGRVEDVKIVRGVKGGKGLDDEALRVIKSRPLWEPALQNNRPVKVLFTYPVNFVLR